MLHFGTLDHLMTTSPSSHQNLIIASLSIDFQKRFLSACEQVELVFGEVINEPGDKMHHVYFPTDSYISLVMPIDGKPGLEVALVGDEGMYGIPLTLSLDTSLFHAMVQGSGLAWADGCQALQA